MSHDDGGAKYTFKLPKVSAAGMIKGGKPCQESLQTFFDTFNGALEKGDVATLSDLFHEEAWLRDFLTLSWDFRTINGATKISKYFADNTKHKGLRNVRPRSSGAYTPSVRQPGPGMEWVETIVDFETEVGHGSGIMRLVSGDDGKTRVYLISLAMQGLKGHEENTKTRRPHGGNNSLVNGSMRGNWHEKRERQKDFLDEDPSVVVIGAGQAGLDIGARLGQLNVPTLIIDRNARIGDNWRSRYRTLVTHDPVQYCHMPYLSFPPSWPTFTPKDKLADWFEAYASLMELNVWLSTTVQSASYNEDKKTWEVKILRSDGSIRIMHPNHVVLATGHSGEAHVPSFQGQDQFKGTVYHTSQHQDASMDPEVKGKKVVVVGSGNSGHDISQNFYENGADVTMLQRRGTYVIDSQRGLFMIHKGVYDETGPPTEDADIYNESQPMPVQFAFNVFKTQKISAVEQDSIDGLTKAGFKLDFGSDDSGLFRKYMTRGGGYYIDVGASKLIVDGKIKVHQSPDGIKEFVADGLILADGTKLKADVVVLATGYDNMRTTARKIMGDKVADRLYDVWDLDEEGELRAIWRYSGHPGFWYMGGNLALCRVYSRFLALQIKASEEGLYTPPAPKAEGL